MVLRAGEDILGGKYHIIKLLGEGGTARVWLANEPGFDNRLVAIKELREDLTQAHLEDMEECFRTEIEMAKLLDKEHAPHVVYGLTIERMEDGRRLLVMQYKDGETLKERIQKNPNGMPVEESIRITLEVLAALEAFHNITEQPVHRDIKPSNIIFDAQGRAYLSDFGFCLLPGRSSRTRGLANAHPGTPLYMAPEQVRPDYQRMTDTRARQEGSAPELAALGVLTAAADMYAVGATLYEMLTGKTYKRVKPGTTIRDLRKDVPLWLDAVVAKALLISPWDRYQSAKDFATALREQKAPDMETTVTAKDATHAKRGFQPALAIAGVTALLVVAFAVVFVLNPGVFGALLDPTPTDTPVPIAVIETNTATPANTATWTVAPTDTPVPTASHTPTATASNTATHTRTSTPTETPTSTETPLPSATNTPTATGTPTGTATETWQPTSSPTPSSTLTPSPTPGTAPGSILEVGETWRQGKLEVKLVSMTLTPGSSGGDLWCVVEFTNTSSQELLLTYSENNFAIVDNLNQAWVVKGFHEVPPGWWCNGVRTVVLGPGKTRTTKDDCGNSGKLQFQGDIHNVSVTELILTIDGISSVENARWRISINR
jgi:serine/threonine protein kinase